MMRPEQNNPKNRHNTNGREEQQRMVREILANSKVRLTPRSYRGPTFGSLDRMPTYRY